MKGQLDDGQSKAFVSGYEARGREKVFNQMLDIDKKINKEQGIIEGEEH